MDLTETLDHSALLPDPADTPTAAATEPGRGASPAASAILSLVFPGLGQLVAGAVARGFLVALPTLALVFVLGTAVAEGPKAVLATVVRPEVLYGLIVVNGLYAIYHFIAIADAYWVARRLRGRPALGRRSTVVLIATLGAAVALHGLVGALGVRAYQTVSTVIVGPGSGFTIPLPGFGPGSTAAAGESLAPTPTPGPHWADDGRLNLLLLGGDAGPGRFLVRTDTMILLSVDVATGRAALFGIPRNLLNVPLPPESAKAFPDGRFPGLLNALWVYAIQHPREFPAGDCKPDTCDQARGFRAITGAIQQLTGVPLDGAMVVNLNGFVDLVDAVGGLWIRTERVHDTRYPLENGRGYVTIDISAGCHHLSGHLALAYARSRHQDSDYGRMARQQQVLVALLHQIDPIALLPHVPDLLDIAQDNLTLAIPSADIGSLASLASAVDPAAVKKLSFDPPEYQEYLTMKEIGRIQKVVRTVFTTPAAPSSSPSPSPAATPTATPKTCGPG
jgi:LCP family protein required for cell wall assembly